MTDGERLVWATSYSLAFDRGGDAVAAALSAARAVEQLREAAQCKASAVALHLDARDLLDEIVSVP